MRVAKNYEIIESVVVGMAPALDEVPEYSSSSSSTGGGTCSLRRRWAPATDCCASALGTRNRPIRSRGGTSGRRRMSSIDSARRDARTSSGTGAPTGRMNGAMKQGSRVQESG